MAGSRVVVMPHDSAWRGRAALLIADLGERLGRPALRIEHIGSTAVPGMAAKDLIDLQVSVAELESAAREFDGPLSGEGYRRLPYEADHIPAGIEDEPARWAKRLWTRRGHVGGDVNLHMRVAGSPNERLALLFRDWMRAHPTAVSAYSAFKCRLADAVADLDTYAQIKDPVVDLVIAAAEPWAAANGWSA